MTLNNQVLLTLGASLVLLLAGTHGVRAAPTTSTTTVALHVKFTAPPCSIIPPPEVFLGAMLPGEHSYPAFNIDISCPPGTPVNTALYAEPVGNSLTAGRTDRVDMSGPAGSSGTPAQLWLAEAGSAVALDGAGSTDTTKQFCAGNTDRQCVLTPSTFVSVDTPRGETRATLRFSIAYP
ncbi:Uncharacterised protein [Citrobacter werkmanii]|uniref:Fimbrial protein n=1 Tax=Citrobacter werkmanii TaxID=67827 RepID=A0A9N8GTA5_9ENTR|nr:Uncharacterised protein [Citrobacter werkmanii]CAB5546235.1 Uncharacterised protein [Citrobacter werkmanii]CAB5566791.1 Uncharacterised protein [Citrobacter werkmanii]CAB5575881.1 Uncharacterised protein [Citrobacter werkmanii]CAB5596758.1 Uncharacterised protein [Citrobacter werkmanii]